MTRLALMLPLIQVCAARVVDRHVVSWASPARARVPHEIPRGRPNVPFGPFLGNGDVALLYTGASTQSQLPSAPEMDWQQWFYLSKNDMWGSDKTLQSDGIHLSAGRLGIRVAPPISTSSENGRLRRGTAETPAWTCNIFNCTCQGMADY